MGKSERWDTLSDFQDELTDSSLLQNPAGVTVYVDDKGRRLTDAGESPVCVIGSTGTGKSQCVVLPTCLDCYSKRESLVVFDSKNEVLRKTGNYIPSDYRVVILNLREPLKSTDQFNPLNYIYRLYKSSDPQDNHDASQMLSSLCEAVYPPEGHDPFWQDAARQYLEGLIYAMFEIAESEEEVNLKTLIMMMEKSEKKSGAGTVIKALFDLINDPLAKINLATYVNAPSETRGSIHSVAFRGTKMFYQSAEVMKLLCGNTLDLETFDLNKPFVFFIITPDETDIYSKLVGVLITNFVQFLIRKAYQNGGELPIRVNLLLEELGSVGKSIPILKNILAVGRSRRLRPVIILQSYAQLEEIYGKSDAATIRENIGTTIGFSTSGMETLEEWSKFCGKRRKKYRDVLIEENLISINSLAAMPAGMALIILNRRYKFIAKLPFFNELFRNGNPYEQVIGISNNETIKVIDIETYVQKKRHEIIWGVLADKEDNPDKVSRSILHKVIVNKVENSETEEKIVQIIMKVFNISYLQAKKRLRNVPEEFYFQNLLTARAFSRAIVDAGGMAIVESPMISNV